jgi:hypothetical protein
MEGVMERKVCTYCGREGHRASSCPNRLRERDIEARLAERLKTIGGEVRKVKWIGRDFAPDRVMMMPPPAMGTWAWPDTTIWVEVKNPETIKTFPATPRERAQYREHQRMRAVGQRVEVVGTYEQIEELFK